jgi:hypothetical protein
VARAKRRRRKSRAFGFFLLAGLTLLIAGFIARREIPFLIRHSYRRAPAAVNSDNAPARTMAVGDGALHHSGAPAKTGNAPAKTRNEDAVAVADQSAKGAHVAAEGGEPPEETTRSDRQRLGNLIRERSR